MASAYSLSTEGHKMKNERIFSTLCWGIVPERVMHDHKREPRNNGYYMRREYNIDLLNEIFLLVNVTLFTGFLRSLPCCCTLIQKPFFSIMTKVEMGKDIDLLNEIFLLVNVTLFTGFLRSLPCCCTLIQKHNKSILCS